MKRRECFKYNWVYADRETNFFKHGFYQMEEYRKNGEYCDVTLVATGENGEECVEIPAHKLVLVVSSPYFAPLFQNGMVESTAEKIEIKKDPKTLMAFVTFMYTATMEIEEDDVQSMIDAANYFHFPDIVEQCGKYLVGSIDDSNCLQLHAFAARYSISALTTAAFTHAIQNFNSVHTSHSFLQICETTLVDLISSDNLRIANEELVFEAVLLWVRAEEDTRREALPRLLEHIRFPLMRHGFLLETVADEPLIDSQPACRRILANVYKHVIYSQDGHPSPSIESHPRSGYHPSAKYSFAVSADHWTTAPAMRTKRKWHAAAAAAGKLFVVGGHNGSVFLDACECLDPVKRKWRSFSSVPVKLHAPGLCSIDTSLYAVGGLVANGDKITSSRDVFIYDIKSDKWMKSVSATLENRCDSVAVRDGVLYAAGSCDLRNKSNSAEMWDPRTVEWQRLPPMLAVRSRPQMVVVGDRVYAIGDCQGDEQTVEYYDVRAEKWVMHEATVRSDIKGYRACECEGEVLLTGGLEISSWKFPYHCKILRDDCWTDGPVLESRCNHALCTIDGTLFSIGGYCGRDEITDAVHSLTLNLHNY